jgi:hypothetical protein
VGRGEVEQAGSIVFSSPRRSLPLEGGYLERHPVASPRLRAAFSARKLKVTEEVATRLNKKLRPRQQFEAGQFKGKLADRHQPGCRFTRGSRRAVCPTRHAASIEVRMGPAGDCVGGPGNDYCHHGTGSDGCWGGRGDDVCVMGPGQDGCHGGPGNDRLYGGAQPDQLYGGRGNDYCNGGPGWGKSHACDAGARR